MCKNEDMSVQALLCVKRTASADMLEAHAQVTVLATHIRLKLLVFLAA